MKVAKLLLFILVMIERSETMNSLVSEAIQQIVREYFLKNSVNFYVLYDSNEVEDLDKTIKLISEEKSFDLIQLNQTINVKKSAIAILNSLENLIKFEDQIKYLTNIFDILIYCKEMTKEQIFLPPYKDQYRTYMIKDDNGIGLYGAMLFTQQQCRNRQLVEINRFSATTRKWRTNKFFTNIIEDFFGCELVFGLNFGGPYAVAEDRKSFKVEGYLIDMIKAMSSNLNFTIGYSLLNESEFKKEEWDMGVGLYIKAVSNPSDEDILISPAILSSALVVVVPPGPSYTPLEKFLLPFDDATWIWILITFGVACIVVILVRMSKSQSIYEWIIGLDIRDPFLNIFGTLMGIGMMSLPRTNIARFLLMNFILFCLIMRTAYQGKYFEFLTSNPTKKPIMTFEELTQSNLTIYADCDCYQYSLREAGIL